MCKGILIKRPNTPNKIDKICKQMNMLCMVKPICHP